MKSILIIMSQSPLAGQNILESLSAAMVMATYGVHIRIMLTGDAVALLRPMNQSQTDTQRRPFKSAFALIESFEFYDLLPIWIDQKDSIENKVLLETTTIEHEVIDFNSHVLASFDGVLRW